MDELFLFLLNGYLDMDKKKSFRELSPTTAKDVLLLPRTLDFDTEET